DIQFRGWRGCADADITSVDRHDLSACRSQKVETIVCAVDDSCIEILCYAVAVMEIQVRLSVRYRIGDCARGTQLDMTALIAAQVVADRTLSPADLGIGSDDGKHLRRIRCTHSDVTGASDCQSRHTGKTQVIGAFEDCEIADTRPLCIQAPIPAGGGMRQALHNVES